MLSEAEEQAKRELLARLPRDLRQWTKQDSEDYTRLVVRIDWQRTIEGFCAGIDCGGKLRTLTAEEQVQASNWLQEPFGICTKCNGLHARPRPGSDLYGAPCTSISWNDIDRSNPLGAGGIGFIHGMGLF